MQISDKPEEGRRRNKKEEEGHRQAWWDHMWRMARFQKPVTTCCYSTSDECKHPEHELPVSSNDFTACEDVPEINLLIGSVRDRG